MKEFVIPTPTMPTDEQMKEVAERWWSTQAGVNFLDWNSELLKNTLPLEIVKIPVALIDATLALADFNGTAKEVTAAYAEILSPVLKKLDCENSFFIKLISRSPKDVLQSFEFTNIRDAVGAITLSCRCFDDLCLLRYIDMGYVVIRPFADFKRWQEWRVFVEEEVIAGISQYYYDTCFSFSEEKLAEIESEIRVFVNHTVTPNMKVRDFVADIIISDGESPTILLETNPYGLSHPCLFKDYKSLDGSFKYTHNQVEI